MVEEEAVLCRMELPGGVWTDLVPAMDDRVVKTLYMLKNCQCRDIDNAQMMVYLLPSSRGKVCSAYKKWEWPGDEAIHIKQHKMCMLPKGNIKCIVKLTL